MPCASCWTYQDGLHENSDTNETKLGAEALMDIGNRAWNHGDTYHALAAFSVTPIETLGPGKRSVL
jgi:hypothetical protein